MCIGPHNFWLSHHSKKRKIQIVYYVISKSSRNMLYRNVTLHHELGLVPPNIKFEILQYSKSVFSPLLNGENGLKIA